MLKMLTLLKIFLIIAVTPLFGISSPISYMPMKPNERIIVNNRILATIRGQTISVIDVMKKMDVFLNQHYPDAMKSPSAKYQFYIGNWRSVLEQMIDNELIMADAESIELKISDGDLREALQERFGPNIMATLDTIGISYEEAREMTRTEMIAQRMHWFRVNSKALITVHPKDVKKAYELFCREHPPIEEWKYQVITIKNNAQQMQNKLASRVLDILHEAKNDFDHLAEKLQEKLGEDALSSITISKEFNISENSMSQAHKEVLLKMTPGTISDPIQQWNRIDNQNVHRIYYLKDHIKKDTPSFYEVSNNLQDSLIQNAISSEMGTYIQKLHKRFGYENEVIEDMIPSDFEPFTLY